MSDEIVLRRAVAADGQAVGELWVRSFGAALPGVQRAHTDEETVRHLADDVVPDGHTWIAQHGTRIVGMMTIVGRDRGPAELDQLYVDPEFQGRGVGRRLLDQAKGLHPEGFELWTFQVNDGARRFYRREGCLELFLTDGADNEEREPDVRLAWRA